MTPSERAAVEQAHRQFGEPTATPKPRAGEHVETPETNEFAYERLRGPAQTQRYKNHNEWLVFARKLEAERDLLREALRGAEALRPKMLKDFGYVPEYVLDFCNRARALTKHGR